MATNRFVCEVCNKGFQREQNLQLHRRGHNLPWKLKQKNKQDPVRKKVYLCPESSCVHHDPSRALGDLTGIKKHYFRKHGEKKFKCEKCAKRYAVQSDWKAHSKTCGTREYRCDCGTLFSRRDSFITHRAFCDALAQESRQSTSLSALSSHLLGSTGDVGGAGNNMSLGMGLSHQVTSHLPSLSDHQLASNILRPGGGPRHYDRLVGSPFRPQQLPPNFYLPDQLGPNQSNGGGFGNCGQDQNQVQNVGGGMFSVSNNLFNGQLNQLQNLQGGSSQPFNLGFFNNNINNSTTDTNTINSGSTGSGDNSSGLFSPGTGLYGGPVQMNSSNNGGLSSLYNNGSTLQHQSAMSATALLQKASQMGSTTSTTNATSANNAIMKGFMAKPPQPPPSPPTSGGGFEGFYGETDQNNLHDQLIRDLSRDNNNLMNSSPFHDGGNHYRGHNGGINANNKPAQGGLSAVSSDNPTRDFLGVGAIVRSKSGGNSNGISMANLNAHNAGSNNTSNAISNTNNVNYSMPISNQAYGGGNGFQ